MSKNNSGRSTKITKALNKMEKTARRKVAKREVLHFRIDQSSISAIYEMASNKEKPVGTMIREWVLERLQKEQDMPQLEPSLKNIEQRLSALEKTMTKKA